MELGFFSPLGVAAGAARLRAGAPATGTGDDDAAPFRWLRMVSIAVAQGVVAPSRPPDGVTDAAAWAVQPVAITAPTSLDEEGEPTAQGYARVINALRQRGATVILVSPPLAGHKQADECTAQWRALRAEVARRTESPLLDWAGPTRRDDGRSGAWRG